MILKMKKMALYGHQEQYQDLLQELLQGGVLHLSDPTELSEYQAIAPMVDQTPADLFALEQLEQRIASALAFVSPYEEKKGLFTPPPTVRVSSLQDPRLLDEAGDVCAEIEAVSAQVAAAEQEMLQAKTLVASLQPWLKDDAPLEQGTTDSCVIHRMMVAAELSFEEMQDALDEQEFACYLSLLETGFDYHFFVLICPKEQEVAVLEHIRDLGASMASFPTLVGTAAENSEQLTARLVALEDTIAAAQTTRKELSAHCERLRIALDAVAIKRSVAACQDCRLDQGNVFVLTGWVLAEQEAAVTAMLSAYDCHVTFADASESDDPPVALRNNRFARSFESITGMYALPDPRSLDPNPSLSIFFALFFGMMFSDAGYGIILMVVGFLFAHRFAFQPKKADFFRLVGFCGVSTTIWGTIYGSFFGDFITVFAHTFLGKTIKITPLLDPIDDAITILLLSMALGAVHILAGMGLKAYLMVKRGKSLDAVFDVGFWVMFLIGLPLMLVGGTAGAIGKWLTLAGLLGLVLTQGRSQKNPVMRLVSGVLSLYDLSGFLSDILSYSRVLALGLATAVIANVVNLLGGMSGGGVVGLLLFLVIFLIGHAINFGLSALGAYVHSSRLQYVEFFGKFYEAGGRPFDPLRPSANHVLIQKNETSS